MTTQKAQFGDVADTEKRLDQIGWGIFLVMMGTIWLVPSVPPGTWLVGTGIVLLAINMLRIVLHVPWSGFWVAVGAIVLTTGLGDFIGISLPLFPICLVVIGAGLILKPLLSQRA